MPAQVMWTALPNGLVGSSGDRRLRVSVMVSPRLTTPDRDGVLSAFPDFRHWTSAMAATRFAVELDGAVVTDGLQPRNVLEPELWDALFTDQTPVRSYAFRDYSRHQLNTYPVRPLRDQIQHLYGSLAADTGLGPPVIFETEPTRGLFLDLQGFRAGASPASSTVAAFLQFHERPARPNAPLPQTEEQLGRLLDFHQAVACLNDYPLLLRQLGLVFDLEAPAETIPAAAVLHSLRVLPHWEPADPTNVVDISPATRSIWDGSNFAAHTSRTDIEQGLLNLDEGVFHLVDTDIDGAVHKVVNLATNLVDIKKRDAVDRPRTAALPTLHSAGLSLIRDARAQTLSRHLEQMSAQNAVLEGPNPETAVFEAEQLVRGYQVDVWDSNSQNWHSLCARVGTYRFERSGIVRTIQDEGFVQLAAAGVPTEPGQPPPAPELYLHESMFRWNGWSLVAPRPGLTISRDGDPSAAPQRPDNAAVTSFALQTTFDPADGSLPTLRFGVGYRLRVRVVDLAGNSRTLEESGDVPALPSAAPGHVYLRYEPVPSPVVVLRKPLSREAAPGESLDRVVVRTANSNSGQDSVPSADTADRHIGPPRTTQALAEAHGAFDDETGRLRGDRATYQMIRERDAAQLNQDGDVPTEPAEKLVLPYLPDVLARGAALRGLPGAPEGTIGTVDEEGQLIYRPMELLQSGSVTQVDFGPASRWPAMQPFRLVLREGSDRPTWDARKRVLTVALPKGEVAEVDLSCYFHRADLKLLGVWDWIRREIDARSATAQDAAALERVAHTVLPLTQRALEGGHWALTPSRPLVLAHAVQQPLGAPAIDKLAADRDFGSTAASLLGTVRVHPSSTAKIDLVARWDELPGSGPEPLLTRPAEDSAGELRLHHQERPQTITFGANAVADYDPSTSVIRMDASHHIRHEFGDTKHRAVRYRAIATSRFSEYFARQAEVTLRGTTPVALHPEGIALSSESVRSLDGSTMFTRAEDHAGDYEVDYQAGTIARTASSAVHDGQSVHVEFLPPVNRDSDEVMVHVPSSARPAAPRVLYVVPAFEWRRQTGSNMLASHRHGHWLRVYLDGPWFSSGEGEQLGVVVSPQAHEPHGELARYVTRTALDPIRSAGSLPSEFPQGQRDGPLTLDELEPIPDNRVNVYGHNVAFDADRGLWYSDIVARGGTAFEPFIRLALARYQPHSVVEFDPAQPEKLRDVKLSRVVVSDFAQLNEDRSVLVTYDPYRPAHLQVAVSGGSYERTLESGGSSRIEVSVQEREPGLEGDLAWVPAKDVAVHPDQAPAGVRAAVLWRGDVNLPEDRPSTAFRIVVEEWDTLLADDPTQPPRLLYADALELASFDSLDGTRPNPGTVLTTAPNPSVFGETVTVTATVTGPETTHPTGEVTFTDAEVGDGTHTLGIVPLTAGRATLPVSDFPVGTHFIAGSYGGDSSIGPASGVVAHRVDQVGTTTDAMQLARHFLDQSRDRSHVGQLAEAVAAAQAAVDVLHGFQPTPDLEERFFLLLAEALHTLVQRLKHAGRPGEMAQPAQKAAQAYQQAAHVSTGESTIKIADLLLHLSTDVSDVFLTAAAVTAAQTAVNVLHDIQPPSGHEAEYFSSLARVLHDLVVRLTTAGRPGEVAQHAREAAHVYRQAASVSAGETVMQIAAELLTLSSRVAAIALTTEAVAAAQAAVDVLRDIQPPPGQEAEYFSLLAQALHTLTRRHIEDGNSDQARAAARETIQAYRQIAATADADVAAVGNNLLIFSSELGTAGLEAESTAAAQAAVEVQG
ncbi:Ig-like domain-containing protein [Streptomyces canus]|uniref:Ig-like domain-containing protein n=1 Tax=Streptomyces canus TaxID=58343 RepID=UPI0022543FFE|nr:Ig-like domain-containing protein [Streptomyces canus]MCX5256818.1 Ig-like domain-containing protein [Streptomyces canus]